MSSTLSFREGLRGAAKPAYIARLHEEGPLYKDSAGFWVVSGFEDVRDVLLDYRRFSSTVMGAGAMGGAGLPLIGDDPPRHSTLRSLVSKAFTPAAIEALRPWVDSLARDLAAKIEPGAETDVVAAFTTPLPVTVIARMMGIPENDHERFKRWSNALTGMMDNPFDPSRAASMQDLFGFFATTLAERRSNPGGTDLISALTRADEAGVLLSDSEIVGFCVLLLVAGNETTTNLLGNLISNLCKHPDAWARLKTSPALRDAAIEESLRIDSPAQMLMRVATEDAEVGGQTIAKDEMVMVFLAAANRDPAKWDDPANFDVARERERHVAFGHGVHTCIGAPLARLEAQCAMAALLERFDGVAYGQERGRRLPGGMLHGFRSLPVVFC